MMPSVQSQNPLHTNSQQVEPPTPTRPVRKCAAGAPHFKCMTINLNGIRTKISKGKRRMTKATALRLYAQGESLDFIGIWEPHLYSAEDVSSVEATFNKGSYHFICYPSNTGRGGAAIAVHYRWTVKHSFTIDDRILIAIVTNVEGRSLVLVSTHFDHCPEE